MPKRKPYNVIGYQNGSRIMKESLTATSRQEAIDIGREVLRARGFNPDKIKIEVVDLNPNWMDQLFGSTRR